jgi:hypothetical protein
MVMSLDDAVSYTELGPRVAKAAAEARERRVRMMVIESELGRFKIVVGNYPWTPKVRAYIDSDGTVTESFFAVRKGFVLPRGES